VDEGRKRTLLIAASILASRKFSELGGKPSPVLDAAIGDAIVMAEKILARIDAKYHAQSQSMDSSAAYPWKNRG
jgi:hypothetical protein